MDLLKLLRKEEGKLLAVSSKVETKLSQIRAAINALSTNGHKPYRAGVSKLRGRKLSAAHRQAIKRGIARARAAKA